MKDQGIKRDRFLLENGPCQVNLYYAAQTFTACKPLGLFVMSNVTAWPSSRDLKPLEAIPEK